MSASDEDDKAKDFLSRWSQRKQEAKQESKQDERGARIVEDDTAQPAAEAETPPEFDLSSLPKLEELTATTDMTVFLRKGVPEHIKNAALRKSWALDPAIRNYVNPALDYAYDWNTPGGVPGSGELSAGMDVAKMVRQIMGSPEPASADPNSDQPAPPQAIDPDESGSPASHINSVEISETNMPDDGVRLSDATPSPPQKSAESTQSLFPQEPDGDEIKSRDVGAPQQEVRRHGTAKPRV